MDWNNWESYEGMVWEICKRLHCLEEDAMQEGRIGVLKALKGFDPSKGVKLDTFVYKCVWNEISRYKREFMGIHRKGITEIIKKGIRDNNSLEDIYFTCKDKFSNISWDEFINIYYQYKGMNVSMDDDEFMEVSDRKDFTKDVEFKMEVEELLKKYKSPVVKEILKGTKTGEISKKYHISRQGINEWLGKIRGGITSNKAHNNH